MLLARVPRGCAASSIRRLVVALAVSAVALVVGCGSERDTLAVSGKVGGNEYRITVANPPRSLSADSLRNRVQRLARRITAQLSPAAEQSALHRFNDADAQTWVNVSPELATLVRTALALGRRTDGAFDITASPLLALWGHTRASRAPPHPPSTRRINKARENTGLGLIEVRRDPPALRKKTRHARLSLAAVQNGFTVDRLARALERAGAKAFLVQLGDGLFARGTKADGSAWQLDFNTPGGDTQVVELADAGMATVSDHREPLTIDGRRIAATIDPRTGRPVAHALRSVTVIGPDATSADALASALLVMGPRAGQAYAQANDIAALLVEHNAGAYIRHVSQAFEDHIGQQ